MILMTAATGKTGHHVIQALREQGESVRALARSDKLDALEGEGVETIRGNLLDIGSIEAAMEGVRAVVHVGPTFDPREIAMGQNVVDAAKRAGVERVVYFSVYHPQLEFLLNHQAKSRVEDYLVTSGLAYTILQPMHYLQAIDPVQAVRDGAVRLPYSMQTPLSFVDIADVAEVAAKVLTEEGHINASYPLCGSDLLSGEQVAAIIAKESKKHIGAEQIPLPAFIEMVSGGHPLPQHVLDGLYRLFTYYGLHGITGNPNVLRWLLGREPTTMAEYVRRSLASEAEGTKPLGDLRP